MKKFVRLKVLLLLLVVAMGKANAQEGWNCDENGCKAAIAQTEYFGREAWQLSDGKTEAIVVPSLGRVMSFKRVGGENWLWSALSDADEVSGSGGWKNWGGDKTWLSPQSRWAELGGTGGWPPVKEWEQMPFESQVLSGGKLKIWGPVSPATGLRISRVFYHDENGEFVVEQTVSQTHGAPIEAGIWNVAQVNSQSISAVFLARSQVSDYPDGFRALTKIENIKPQTVSPNLLQVVPGTTGHYKIGTDAPRAAIVATRGEWAFVLKAPRPDGLYPDGEAGKKGTSVQLFGITSPKASYLELELLSPLLQFKPGARWTHTVRWSVQQLPSASVGAPAVHTAIDRMMD